jgi:ribosomal protein S18 acetylase RimI-like enzyme
MESNYALYIKEREGKEIIEDEKGFATFVINDKECYIIDIFVKEEHRKEKIASKYADQITEFAKVNGCLYLTGSVCPSAKGSNESLKVLLGYGFELQSSINNMIFFRKVI